MRNKTILLLCSALLSGSLSLSLLGCGGCASTQPRSGAASPSFQGIEILPEEKELAPFQSAVSGHAGTNVQYTKSVVAKVSLWLERHDYPESFEYRGKKYTLRYSAAA